MSLPAFSVRQVVLVNLVFIIVLIAGVQTSRQIPVDMFPDISFNTALISTLWVGASPEEVERLLTKKLEDEINSISGIKEMISVSGDGLSEIYIEWQESLSEMECEAALNGLRGAIVPKCACPWPRLGAGPSTHIVCFGRLRPKTPGSMAILPGAECGASFAANAALKQQILHWLGSIPV